MKKRVIFIILAFILVLSGCGNSGKTSEITVILTPSSKFASPIATDAPDPQSEDPATPQVTESPTKAPATPFMPSENIYSNSAFLNELHDDGDVTLLDINSDMQIYPASMTKMMTAVIFLETEGALDRNYTVPQSIFHYLWESEASVAGFEANEEVSGTTILYGILLPSGADACLTAAIALYGSEDAFVVKMNEKAKEIGMNSTHFVNTTGLHDDNHYTTVRDIYVLMKYALTIDALRTAMTTAEYTMPATKYHPDGIVMKNTTINLSSKLDYGSVHILGGKTGYTSQAGLCLASYAEHDGNYYILVTAGNNGNSKTDPYHFLDAQTIYSYLG